MKCENCEIGEMQNARLKDFDLGDILVTARFKYCPECLWTEEEEITLSK